MNATNADDRSLWISHGGLRFEGHLEPGDLLDFYLLEAPSLDPAGLPSQGPVPGLRKRIYPSLP